MDVINNFMGGLASAMAVKTLLFCFIGVTFGTFIGVLPGLGSMAAISMLLPFTYYLDSVSSLVMIAGIYYGAQYGGSTAAILLNLPGTAASAVTCLDGYPLAKAGRAGAALFVTCISSFFGGIFAIAVMAVFAPLLAGVALKFGSAEYFSIMILGLVTAATLATGSFVRGFAMVVFGLLAGLVGADVDSGVMRFTFGETGLADGLNLVAVAMGLFGVAEILANMRKQAQATMPQSIKWRELIASRKEFRDSIMPTIRGSFVGSAFGILPGAGGTIASFMAYAVEVRTSRDQSRFGKGAIEGIAAPEAANNSAVQSAFIPTLTIGIPGDATMAIILGALMIHGILPGPQLITEHGDLFWTLVASFFIGNVMLLVLNLPLIGIWVRILQIPYRILYPAVLFFICIGVFSINNNAFDVLLVLGSGVVGYFALLYSLPVAPFLLGFVLGPLMEEHLRRALLLGDGNILVLFQQPISASFLGMTFVVIAIGVFMGLRGKKRPDLSDE